MTAINPKVLKTFARVPSLFISLAPEEEFPEWIERWSAGEAIINALIVHVRFEPEFEGGQVGTFKRLKVQNFQLTGYSSC
jgi:hypothetical protein